MSNWTFGCLSTCVPVCHERSRGSTWARRTQREGGRSLAAAAERVRWMQSVSAQRRSSGGALATIERKEQAVRSTVAFSFLHAKVWTKQIFQDSLKLRKSRRRRERMDMI